MIPHERSLVEQLKDKPFTLLGVNTDADKDEFRAKSKAQKVTWRSAWTGSTSNAISRKFRVEGYPTVFLLDHEGVIRKKWVGSPGDAELEKAIDELLAKVPAAK